MSDLPWSVQFNDAKKGRVEMVAQHVMVDHVLDFASDPEDFCVRVDRMHIDRQELLELMPRLACLSKSWNQAIRSRVEYAALRVASSLNKTRFWNANWLHRRGTNPVEEFDRVLYVFSNSWKVAKPLPTKLKTSALGDLSNSDLCLLYQLLKSGWMDALKVIPGDGQELLDTVWVTPAQRAKTV